MDRNAMGHTLVRFYLAHGSVLPLLDMLTIREIHQTGEPTKRGKEVCVGGGGGGGRCLMGVHVSCCLDFKLGLTWLI